jgi:beta-galactosidase
MREANVNVATLPVFGWEAIQPAEDVYTFDWLDEVIGKLHGAGIRLCLATPTASMPPWMAKKYPQTQRVEKDGHGIRRPLGNRQNTCPNSPEFRRLSVAIARKMGERYGKHPALLLWHVSNEYAHPCYCETCAAAFRTWLQRRYETLDALNDRWTAAFWGQRYSAWEQINPTTHDGQGCQQAVRIDYDRFQTDSMLECFRAEKAVLREITPTVPVTTNMMGFFKPIDYHRWADDLDVVSWDANRRDAVASSDGGQRAGDPAGGAAVLPGAENVRAGNLDDGDEGMSAAKCRSERFLQPHFEHDCDRGRHIRRWSDGHRVGGL